MAALFHNLTSSVTTYIITQLHNLSSLKASLNKANITLRVIRSASTNRNLVEKWQFIGTRRQCDNITSNTRCLWVRVRTQPSPVAVFGRWFVLPVSRSVSMFQAGSHRNLRCMNWICSCTVPTHVTRHENFAVPIADDCMADICHAHG